MMVDDDDVAFERASAHLGDEAAIKLRTFLACAGIRARIDLVPKSARFGQSRDLCAIAGLCMLLPFRNRPVLLNLRDFTKDRLILEIVEFLAAQIVVASLHVADAQLAFAVGEQHLFQEGNVLIEELFLEIFRSSGDDYALTGTNSR